VNKYFSIEEKKTFEGMDFARKNDWILGRIAAKRAVARLLVKKFSLRIAHNDVNIVYLESGKPQVEILNLEISKKIIEYGLENNIDISISHSGSIALAAVSIMSEDGCVGIDIERERKFSSQVRGAFLNKEDEIVISRKPPVNLNKMVTFYWCAKEAFLKAKGVGIRQHPATVSLFFQEKNCGKIIDKTEPSIKAFFQRINFSKGHVAAVVNIASKY